LPSTRAIETHSRPRSLAPTLVTLPSMSLIPQLHSLNRDVFYVAFPKSSIPSIAKCSMSLIPQFHSPQRRQ